MAINTVIERDFKENSI